MENFNRGDYQVVEVRRKGMSPWGIASIVVVVAAAIVTAILVDRLLRKRKEKKEADATAAKAAAAKAANAQAAAAQRGPSRRRRTASSSSSSSATTAEDMTPTAADATYSTSPASAAASAASDTWEHTKGDPLGASMSTASYTTSDSQSGFRISDNMAQTSPIDESAADAVAKRNMSVDAMMPSSWRSEVKRQADQNTSTVRDGWESTWAQGTAGAECGGDAGGDWDKEWKDLAPTRMGYQKFIELNSEVTRGENTRKGRPLGGAITIDAALREATITPISGAQVMFGGSSHREDAYFDAMGEYAPSWGESC